MKTWQKSVALLDEKQTANSSSGAGNKSPQRCYDMNDNFGESVFAPPGGLCVNTPGPARSHLGQGRAGCIFINHFLTPHQGYAAGSLVPVNCLCIDNAKKRRWDLSSFTGYLWLEN